MRRKNLFTLIELLVVVAVIAILAGIATPVLNKARVRAKASACNSNVKQLITAAFAFEVDYKMLPKPNDDDSDGYWERKLRVDNNTGYWTQLMEEHLGGRPRKGMAWVALCPGTEKNNTFSGDYKHSYGMSNFFDSDKISQRRFSALESPGDTPVFGDSWDGSDQKYVIGDGGQVHLRHNRAANVAFADGSARNLNNKGMNDSFGEQKTYNREWRSYYKEDGSTGNAKK